MKQLIMRITKGSQQPQLHDFPPRGRKPWAQTHRRSLCRAADVFHPVSPFSWYTTSDLTWTDEFNLQTSVETKRRRQKTLLMDVIKLIKVRHSLAKVRRCEKRCFQTQSVHSCEASPSLRADSHGSSVLLMEADTVKPEETSTTSSSNPILAAVSSHPTWVIAAAVITAVIIK